MGGGAASVPRPRITNAVRAALGALTRVGDADCMPGLVRLLDDESQVSSVEPALIAISQRNPERALAFVQLGSLQGSLSHAAALVIAALAPLVAIPLGVITFYLRSLHEVQGNLQAELVRRFEGLERRVSDLARDVSEFARDYTPREEWLRECMHTRGRVERLTEMIGGVAPTQDAPKPQRRTKSRESK